MNKEFRQFKASEMDMATISRRQFVDRMKSMIADDDKANRLHNQECVYCFYGQKIGGAACTSTYCGLCEKSMSFGSTNTDRLCLNCAIEYKLCKHCGANITLGRRSKL